MKRGFPEDGSALFEISEAWRAAFPGAHAGVLALRNLVNGAESAELQQRKTQLEAELRARYAGLDRAGLLEAAVLKAYNAYYRRFNKTYHVQLQLESILFKSKPIPAATGLVASMFMAELSNLLLTAGHDLDAIRAPLRLDVARGSESYMLLRGTPQTPKAGDMMISDVDGIISSIVYGPDQRTQIKAETRSALFTVYAPAGIDQGAIEQHLEDIRCNVVLFAPDATVEVLSVYS
jgi:DNA/RNA-binding domain of Phe-tRNA-synthetase-like protein